MKVLKPSSFDFRNFNYIQSLCTISVNGPAVITTDKSAMLF